MRSTIIALAVAANVVAAARFPQEKGLFESLFESPFEESSPFDSASQNVFSSEEHPTCKIRDCIRALAYSTSQFGLDDPCKEDLLSVSTNEAAVRSETFYCFAAVSKAFQDMGAIPADCEPCRPEWFPRASKEKATDPKKKIHIDIRLVDDNKKQSPSEDAPAPCGMGVGQEGVLGGLGVLIGDKEGQGARYGGVGALGEEQGGEGEFRGFGGGDGQGEFRGFGEGEGEGEGEFTGEGEEERGFGGFGGFGEGQGQGQGEGGFGGFGEEEDGGDVDGDDVDGDDVEGDDVEGDDAERNNVEGDDGEPDDGEGYGEGYGGGYGGAYGAGYGGGYGGEYEEGGQGQFNGGWGDEEEGEGEQGANGMY